MQELEDEEDMGGVDDDDDAEADVRTGEDGEGEYGDCGNTKLDIRSDHDQVTQDVNENEPLQGQHYKVEEEEELPRGDVTAAFWGRSE